MILFSEFGIIHDVTARRPERLDDPCLVTKLVALFGRYRLRPAGSGGKRKPERAQNAGTCCGLPTGSRCHVLQALPNSGAGPGCARAPLRFRGK